MVCSNKTSVKGGGDVDVGGYFILDFFADDPDAKVNFMTEKYILET